MIFKTIFFAVIGFLSLFETVYIVRWINGGVQSAGCQGVFFLFVAILVFMITYIPDIVNKERPDRHYYM